MSVKDNKNPSGDIEVKIIGLKPGEKLYEELLIGQNPQNTVHTKIYKASDPYIPFDQLEVDLNDLKNLLDNNKAKEVKNLLEKVIKFYQSNSKIVDHLYKEQTLVGKYKPESSFVKDNKVVKIK